MTEVHIPMIVWGNEYVDTYLRASLPTQLSEGNLQNLSKHGKVFYHFFSTDYFFNLIKSSQLYKVLESVVSIQFHRIAVDYSLNKFVIVNACHQRILELASGHPILYLNPDGVYANGSFQRAMSYLDQGSRMILIAGLRLVKEDFVPVFENWIQQGNLSDGIPHRALMKFALKTLHPMSSSLFWDNQKIFSWCSQIYWRLKDEGILIRAFHLHPLLIWPEKKRLNQKTTIDTEAIDKICPDPSKWKIIDNSDDILAFELSRRDFADSITYVKKSEQEIVRWCRWYTKWHHRLFFRKKIILHSNGVEANWVEDIEKADAIAESIIKKYNLRSALFVIKLVRFLKGKWSSMRKVIHRWIT